MIPPYPLRHVGPCIVAGAAWCLHDDLERARKLFPDAPVIAVNGASREVAGLLLVTQHPQNLTAPGYEWLRHQRKFGHSFTVHSATADPHVDHVWNLPHRGGSIWLARRIAGLVGFAPVILAGAPMVPGPYVEYRLGGLMQDPPTVDELLRQIAEDVENHAECVSMSGRTAELLGAPC